MFVDFETIADIFSPLDELPVSKKTDIIFMIGVYYKYNNKYSEIFRRSKNIYKKR